MVSDEAMIGILVAGGVLITGAIVFLVVKKKKDKKLEESTSLDFNNLNDVGIRIEEKPPTLFEELQRASVQSPWQIYTDLDKMPNTNNKMALSMGVRIKF